MHILDKPCACICCGRKTIRSYGSNIFPICATCKMTRIRAYQRAAEMSGRTWGSRWEAIIKRVLP